VNGWWIVFNNNRLHKFPHWLTSRQPCEPLHAKSPGSLSFFNRAATHGVWPCNSITWEMHKLQAQSRQVQSSSSGLLHVCWSKLKNMHLFNKTASFTILIVDRAGLTYTLNLHTFCWSHHADFTCTCIYMYIHCTTVDHWSMNIRLLYNNKIGSWS